MSRQVSKMLTPDDTSKSTPPSEPASEPSSDRQAWISLLAKGDAETLQGFVDELGGDAEFGFLRKPETGLAMVRGRTGGAGQPFNLGEMTLTRCVVTTLDSATGERLDGFGCIAGRDQSRAVAAAKLDALFQDSANGASNRDVVLPALAARHAARRRAKAAKTAATKVEFFTMERGR